MRQDRPYRPPYRTGEFGQRIKEARAAAAEREKRELLKRDDKAYVGRLVLAYIARHG